MDKIPVIDVDKLRTSDRSPESELQRLCQSLQQIGFVYLVNHGISPLQIEEVFSQSQQFFQRPVDQKTPLAWTHADSNRGYVGLGREQLNPAQPGDWKEAFNIGREFPPASASSQTPQTPWPTTLPRFRQTMLDFYDRCTDLADELLRAIAIILDLPADFFAQRHDQRQHTLRLLHYPSLESRLQDGQLRAGAHSDYGSLTLLFQDDAGGLEIQTPAGDWMAAPFIPDTILVNIGDLMERWTNHILRSTPHRVVPLLDRGSQPRYAIAFFCHPNDDVEVACLETCHTPAHPPQYPAILAGEYLLHRLHRTY